MPDEQHVPEEEEEHGPPSWLRDALQHLAPILAAFQAQREAETMTRLDVFNRAFEGASADQRVALALAFLGKR